MKILYGLFVFLLLAFSQPQPSFSGIPSLFSESHIVVGSNVSDKMGASLLSNAFLHEGLRIEEKGEDKGNLIVVGGPLANPLSKKYSSIFGIKMVEDGNASTISAEGKSITHQKSNKYEDIAVAHVGEIEERNILLLWGYGRKGTYAACLYLSQRENWSGDHLFFIVWNDKNKDGVVTLSEIEAGKKAEAKGDMINVTLVIDYGTKQERKETKIKKGSTVLDLLRQETQLDYTIWPFGVFVTSINGLANDTTRGYYWLYWVNGVYATVTSDAFVLQEGDIVEWRYRKP